MKRRVLKLGAPQWRAGPSAARVERWGALRSGTRIPRSGEAQGPGPPGEAHRPTWPRLYEDNQDLVGDDPNVIVPGLLLDLCGDAVETGEGDDLVDQAPELLTRPGFVDVATELFPALAGEDGFLSSDDLDAAMTRPDLTLEQSAALVTLRRLRSDLEELHDDEWFDENDGVTMADLEQYRQTGKLPGADGTPEEWYSFERSRMQQFSQEVFTTQRPPDVNAMLQGSIGDCYFLSALGSAVRQDPAAVMKMVTPEPDGTYTVTFPNGQSANVAAPTLAEMATYGNSGMSGSTGTAPQTWTCCR